MVFMREMEYLIGEAVPLLHIIYMFFPFLKGDSSSMCRFCMNELYNTDEVPCEHAEARYKELCKKWIKEIKTDASIEYEERDEEG